MPYSRYRRAVVGTILVTAMAGAARPLASGQAAGVQRQDPARASGNDALSAALLIRDPVQQVAALDRFLLDYPNSGRAPWVNQRILEKSIEARASREQIARRAAQFASSSPMQERPRAFATAAGALLAANLYLDLAERCAQDGLAVLEQPKAVPNQGSAQFQRATLLAVLGRIQVKRGDYDAAERSTSEAYALDPSEYQRAALSVELAVFDKRRGDTAAELEHLAEATLGGAGTEQSQAGLERAYRALHPPPAPDVEQWLDARYRQQYPDSIEAASTAARSPTGRVVLLELFTGAG